MKKDMRSLAVGLVATVLPAWAVALPVIDSTLAFNEVRYGALARDPRLLIIANVSNTVGPVTVTADHANDAWDYGLPFRPQPVSPNQYVQTVEYTGQTGSWTITATDATGSRSSVTHALDDVRNLPQTQNIVLSGNPQAPTVTWNRHDPADYPAVCPANCDFGFDFYSYAVEVRDSDLNIVYVSQSQINHSPVFTTTFRATLPGGLFEPGDDYFIGVRFHGTERDLVMGGNVVAQLENRSVTYLAYSLAPVPEPAATALMLAGLAGVATVARRRRAVR